MDLIPAVASVLFVLGYAAIALEHSLGTSKSAVALALGGILWVLVAMAGGVNFAHDIAEAGSEIFDIIVFLLAAMSLVEVLIHYRFFDYIRTWLFKLGVGERRQFWLIGIMAFCLSSVIDNLTATIVSIQIARKFFRNDNMLVATAGIVIAANAGGAFSPIGDVTTIMLWLAKKFTAIEIISKAFLPSLAIFVMSMALMFRLVKENDYDVKTELVPTLGRSEKVVIGTTLASFALPVVMSLIGLPPYLGLLIGLGFVWLAVDSLKRIRPKPTHLEASLDEFIKKTDIPSIKFFIGILLAVSALHSLGILEQLSHVLYGETPSIGRMVAGNIGLGVISAILDNVPLTAIAIQVLNTSNTDLWVLLALAVGTGGSLLVIGSAAGVVAMGMVKELTFSRYLKIATLPAAVGYAAGMGVWALQTYVF